MAQVIGKFGPLLLGALALVLLAIAPTAHADSPVEASVVTSNRPIVDWQCAAATDAPLCRASSILRMGREDGTGLSTTRLTASSGRAAPPLEPGRYWWQVFSGECRETGCTLRRHEFTIRGSVTGLSMSQRLDSRTRLVFTVPFTANARRATTSLQLSQDGRTFFSASTTSSLAALPNHRSANFTWSNDDVLHGTEVTARVSVLVGGRRFGRVVTFPAPGHA